MCGRYTLHDTDRLQQRLRDLRLLEQSRAILERWLRRYNIAPSESVLAIRAGGDAPDWELVELRWGLLPHWSRERRLNTTRSTPKLNVSPRRRPIAGRFAGAAP